MNTQWRWGTGIVPRTLRAVVLVPCAIVASALFPFAILSCTIPFDAGASVPRVIVAEDFGHEL